MPAKRKYTFFYRVYRKIRYLLYVKKLRRQARKSSLRSEQQIILEGKKKAREQLKEERRAERQKKHHDRLTFNELKHKLKEEYQKNYLENKSLYEKEAAILKNARKREKKFKRYRRKRLLKFYLKICFRNIRQSLKALNPRNIPGYARFIWHNKSYIREFLVITIHSTLFFAAAYLLVFLILLFSAAISGVFFEYGSIVYFYEVLWLVRPEQWFGDSVKMVYASGPILCGILALIFAIVFSYIRTGRGLEKLFILWFFMHLFNAFFGSLLIGSLFGRGFGYAIIWSYISDTEKVIYSLISVTALFLIGVFVTRSFLISANTYYPSLEKKDQQRFIWAQIILPFVLGNTIIALIMFPEIRLYDMTVALTLLITLLPVVIGYRFSHALYFEDRPVKIRLSFKAILLALTFIILYRVVLGMGIRIG